MTDDINDDESGIPLPTIGNAVAKAANTGPGKALLTPVAKAFGDYLGWRAKEITENWKKQRERNLETHAARVQQKEGIPIPREPTEKQVILVSEWIERAQEVNPDDPEISALWQSLLGAIYRKDAAAKEWFEVIKQLNESDARLLLSISRDFRPTNSREQAQATKLASLGLLEGFQWSHAVHRFEPFFIVAIFFLAIAILSLTIPDQIFEKYLFAPSLLLIKPVGVAIGAMGAVISSMQLGRIYLREINSFGISALGVDVRHSALRYLDNMPPVANSETKPSDAANPDELSGSKPTPMTKKSRQGRQTAGNAKSG